MTDSYLAPAGALSIEVRAKMRLAEGYDAAQQRGEVAGPIGNNLRSEAERKPTAADIGLTHKDIHEARQIRNAEVAEPGIVSDRNNAPTLSDIGRAA